MPNQNRKVQASNKTARVLQKPFISIIIPTLNEEYYLPNLLRSIKKQKTTCSYEIIVADAGSVDRTRAIASEYGAKVIKGGKPAVGRNNGAKVARGDIFVFLDADARLTNENWLATIGQRSKRLLKEYPNGFVRAIVPQVLDFHDQDVSWLLRVIKTIGATFLNNWYKIQAYFNFMFLGTGIMYMDKKAFTTLKGFDTSIKMIAEDADLLKRSIAQKLFAGWEENYIELSDRRYNNPTIIILSPIFAVVAVIVEILVKLTGNMHLHTLFFDNIITPLYGPLGGGVKKSTKK